MSKLFALTPVVLALAFTGISAEQSVQPPPAPAQVPAQPPGATETDPDYILDAAFSEGTYRLGPRISHPSVIKEVKPTYTADAMRRRVQGEVSLSVRIGASGTVEAVRIRKSLDRGGLDLEAMRAARQWVFKPAVFDGMPVPVIADLVLAFNLKDRPTTAQ